MIKSISVFGLGKLGSSMAAVFADSDFDVIGVDINHKRTVALNEGRALVYETGLAEMIAANHNRLSATTSGEDAVIGSEVSFIVVPTPSKRDHTFSTEYVINAAETLGRGIAQKSAYHIVVLTSTVLPGVSRRDIIPVLEESSGKLCGVDFGFCYGPEFIALGSVLQDLVAPDYFLIGEYDANSGEALAFINNRVAQKNPTIVRLTIEEAELAKITTNAYVTMKISFANMVAQICDGMKNINVDNVTSAIGLDKRIGKRYLSGGLSFGGPCFPRDNAAVAAFAKSCETDFEIPLTVERFNDTHARYVEDQISHLVSPGEIIGLVGLSYKPGSHVLEESPALSIAASLSDRGHPLVGFDPLQSKFETPAELGTIEIVDHLTTLVEKADVIVLTHRDPELAAAIMQALSNKSKETVLFDCWRIVDEAPTQNLTIRHFGSVTRTREN